MPVRSKVEHLVHLDHHLHLNQGPNLPAVPTHGLPFDFCSRSESGDPTLEDML